MEIKHSDDNQKGRFFVEENGRLLAEMTYIWAGENKIIIDHTEVSPWLTGTGAGKLLLEKVVELARLKGVKIIPLCPFAKSVFDKNKDYQDVL